ncbi:hypothetical protein AGR7A_pAt30124 [Agrobacterium deltaense NCPPB 1641]|uniref:Uncharacterized protein n=1 Tax=Agrobacterium deltaense NCPPB 1641 TaxID=1183425 RepID=A0A1S7UB00_9HYPH|nr:hypothetical protein AGR7A_pAt30124 [Agrobacterium deltaense NCPPB 1641]
MRTSVFGRATPLTPAKMTEVTF